LAEKITAVDELVALIDADRIGKPVAMNNTNSVRVALVSIVTAWNPGWRPLPPGCRPRAVCRAHRPRF